MKLLKAMSADFENLRVFVHFEVDLPDCEFEYRML